MLARKHLLEQIDVEKTSEEWFHQVWRPFWAALNIAEKVSYLQHWNASPKWIHAIGIAFDAPDNSDAGADARNQARIFVRCVRRKVLDHRARDGVECSVNFNRNASRDIIETPCETPVAVHRRFRMSRPSTRHVK